MPPRRTTNGQTDQGSTSTDMLNAAATPMETLFKRFQSFKPPTLAGIENAIECENWLEDIEKLFEALDYTDDRWVKLIVHQLHGLAAGYCSKVNAGQHYCSLRLVEFLNSFEALVWVATGSKRANTRINEEAPRVGYCYARGNQQQEFLTHLLVYASAGLLVCRLVLMTKARRRRFTCERKSVEASM
ncbi:hypothetical protein F511_16755 [Dorcoceras hygrometricum]|uniref:Uncharacterized protein n=1 Tax=Dorcoceras hygrometricum TaxID=472368 RepID=A0A2Z7AMH5_9LAMI|nr:hypothetical protein F511_16755 [Dorcoceras hygrometricum]